jgi:apolipoprotein N-acyltransferase
VAAAAASGVLSFLALPPLDLGPLGFVALVPLLWALRGVPARRGVVLGVVYGLAFYGFLLSWLIPVTVLGWAVLVVGVAAFLGLFGAVVPVVWRDDRPVRTALVVGAAWAAVEWFRGVWPFGGWSWLGLGATQHHNRLLVPLLSVAGAIGLGLVLTAINALLLAAAIRIRRGAGTSLVPVGVAVGLAVAPVAIPLPEADGPSVDVAVVQGNVPLEIGTQSRIISDEIVARNHARLHVSLGVDPPDLAVWPENALDRDPTRDPVLGLAVEASVGAVGVHTLVGAITETEDGRLLNENLLYTPDVEVVGRYAKNHLLPFGEYVPFRRVLDWIPDVRRVREDLSPGALPGRFRIPSGEFASIICFENAFPDLVRSYVTGDTGFLVVSTNNSTFGISSAPEQHVVLSELRAVESGRWVVHGALSGISAVISPRGEVVQRTALFRPAILRAEIPRASGTTVYDTAGGWLPALFLVIVAGGFLGPRRPRVRPLEVLPPDPRVVVVLPTFNERDTVEEAVARTLAIGGEPSAPAREPSDIRVIVVDDSSPDGTGEIVRRLADSDGRVSLMERPGKAGLASAYREGFERALAGGADLVVEMDADLSHRPEELPRLLEGARAHHVVIGSRYVRGGGIRNWGLLRRILSRGGNVYARALLGFPVRDATSGYRVFRAGTLRELTAEWAGTEGYAFQIEMAYRAWRRGFSVGEVPITFEDRRAGASKLSRRIVFEALGKVLLWGLRDRVLRRGERESQSEARRA